jgi:WD40 repeat protein
MNRTQTEKEKQNASEQISLQHIMELREAFDAAKKHKESALELNQFMDSFGGIIGKDMNQKQINQLFMKIDADSNGSVDWNEFMNYMLLENETLSSMKAEHFEYVKSNIPDPERKKKDLCHYDMITWILVLPPEDESDNKFSNDKEEEDKEQRETKQAVRYVTSSQDGTIKIWYGSSTKWEKTIEVWKHVEENIYGSVKIYGKKVTTYWVNCIQYMTKSRRLVAAWADRTLKFYDLTSTNYKIPVSEIADLVGLPLWMDYFLKPKQGLETLVVGDDLGIWNMYDFEPDWHSCEWKMHDKNTVWCHKDEILKRFIPKDEEEKDKPGKSKSGKDGDRRPDKNSELKKIEKALRDNTHAHNKKITAKPELLQYRERFTVKTVQIHNGWITKIKYIEDLNYILSSAFDGFLHFHEIDNLKYKDRSFSLHQKGVNSFVYSERHRFVASCGEERHIIMWDPFTRRAITYLNGHTTSVQDLTINDDRHHLISLGTDKVVKIWDIRTYKWIQTIFDKISYSPEDRLTCILFDKHTNNILLGSRKINRWFFKTQEEIKTSHEYSVAWSLFNTEFESVVSWDDGSFISVWDIENGKLMSKFGNAHGKNIKITASCFDDSQRRLISSGADGSIKVWNFSNGQEISQCMPSKVEARGSEVTDLCFVSNESNKHEFGNILSVGWNKHVYIYPDNKEEEIFESNILPQSDQGVKHEDDIMSVVYYEKNNLVFTGSHEGRLIGWNFETKRAKFELHSEDKTCLSDDPVKDAKSVDCLLILVEKELLLSGTADQWLRFWDTKTGKLVNKVKVNHHSEDALTALATDSKNKVLFSGDTSGWIKKFNLASFNFENGKELEEEWFILAHRAIINNISVVELKEWEDCFIISWSNDRNINLHRFDGLFIGQFGQDEEWDIYNTHALDNKRKRNDVRMKNYGTFRKNTELEKILNGEYDEPANEEPEDDEYEGQEYYKKGYTVTNAASLFGYDINKDLGKRPLNLWI